MIFKPVKSVDMHRSMIGPHDWPHSEGSKVLPAQHRQKGYNLCGVLIPPAAGLLRPSRRPPVAGPLMLKESIYQETDCGSYRKATEIHSYL